MGKPAGKRGAAALARSLLRPKAGPDAAAGALRSGMPAVQGTARCCRKKAGASDAKLAPAWSRQTDLNPRPADYKSAALPTELCRHTAPVYGRLYSISNFAGQCKGRRAGCRNKLCKTLHRYAVRGIGPQAFGPGTRAFIGQNRRQFLPYGCFGPRRRGSGCRSGRRRCSPRRFFPNGHSGLPPGRHRPGPGHNIC